VDSALIISAHEKSVTQLRELLAPGAFSRVAHAGTAGEARRALTSAEYDLFVVNAPLPDEPGENLARRLAEALSGEVILLVRDEHFMESSEKLAEFGIITVSKPLNRTAFWSAVKMAQVAHNRFNMMRRENQKLQQKIEDIRIIDRAKCILISHMKMTEPEAHKFIEKQAMDMRVSRREIAEGVLKTYEN
jgi:response regulator NasT